MPKPLIQTTGRRKEAVARVRLRPGTGVVGAAGAAATGAARVGTWVGVGAQAVSAPARPIRVARWERVRRKFMVSLVQRVRMSAWPVIPGSRATDVESRSMRTV